MTRTSFVPAVLLVPAIWAGASCVGSIAETADPGLAIHGPRSDSQMPGGGGAGATAPDPSTPGSSIAALPGPELAVTGALRRLSSDEYDNTLRDLLFDPGADSKQILIDPRTPFDNDSLELFKAGTKVDGLELLARDASQRLLADKARRDKVVGCIPTGPADMACLKQFVLAFGRRALRRPFGDADAAPFLGFVELAKSENDFYAAVDAVVRAFLQEPEFVYLIEAGTPVPQLPGVVKLGSWEMASRLSYFLWGTMPSDELFGKADQGKLATSSDVRAAAAAMLGDPKAQERVARFHTLWLGYEEIPVGSLATAMRTETDELLRRVVFQQKAPWQDLFRASDTFVDYALARHYGLKLPAGMTATSKPAWVPYAGTKRRGILSQGSILSQGILFDDTSPVLRGNLIRARFMCSPVPPPDPELGVVSDEPPKGNGIASACKEDRYQVHRAEGLCRACHAKLDAVGFGLENYDGQGRYRTTQYWSFDKSEDRWKVATAGTAGATRCDVRGEGDLDGKSFNGPAGLADLLLQSPSLNDCVTTQVYRFATGRGAISEMDRKFIDVILKRIGGGDFRLDELLLDFVSSPAFAHRRIEQ